MVCKTKIRIELKKAILYNHILLCQVQSMSLLKINRIFAVVTVFAVTLFFGCESNFKEVQKINFSNLRQVVMLIK